MIALTLTLCAASCLAISVVTADGWWMLAAAALGFFAAALRYPSSGPSRSYCRSCGDLPDACSCWPG